MQVLEAMQQAVVAAAEAVGPSVVGLGRGWGRGSGVVVAPGRVLTNAHVLRGEEAGVTFADGRVEHGRLLAADLDLDVAVLDVDTGAAPAVAWEPEAVREATLGAPVFAVADPGARGQRTTFGMVSAPERTMRGPRGRRIAGTIEHTAPVPRGASGSPLVDARHRLLGLNTVRLEGGFVLALPADARLHAQVERLGRGEASTRPRLGVALVPPPAARRLRAAVGLPEHDGLLVRGVEAGGPAEQAGLQRGDLVVAAGGRAVRTPDDLFDVLDAAGAELPLTVLRGTEERELTARFTS
jgi:serine protease Do